MTSRAKVFLFAFLLYAALRAATNLPAVQKPRELADTVAYLRVSRQPLASPEFWSAARPFVFPLLLKIVSQDVSAAAATQLAISILAWGFLAWAVGASFQRASLSLFSFGAILLLSLSPRLAGWDYVMMTESLSVSFFVLFLAFGIWLAQGWRAYKAVLLLPGALLLAFARDANAYLLLTLAGLLALAVLLRWARPRVMILAAGLLLVFALNNLSAERGARWVFPLNNNVGKRILTNSEAARYFANCGMPVTPQLLSLAGSFANGQERAFYESPALQDYRAWLRERGKSCYMKYLLANPIKSVGEPLRQFQTLVAFASVQKYFARSYDPLVPYAFEPFLYPASFIVPLWVLLTGIAFYAIGKRLWRANPLWGIYVLLCLPIFPHLFVVWHGDAMATERHALSVGLQLALSFWLAAFLLVEKFSAKGNMEKPNALQKLIHRVLMLAPVSRFLSVALPPLDKLTLRLSAGKITLTGLVGLPVIQLTTVGAKSGLRRTMPLVGLFDGEKIALVGSNFGRANHPSWYYNLKAHPRCWAEVGGRAREYIARSAEGAEREKYWEMAISYYAGYEKYKVRAAPRVIPIMILEPADPPS